MGIGAGTIGFPVASFRTVKDDMTTFNRRAFLAGGTAVGWSFRCQGPRKYSPIP